MREWLPNFVPIIYFSQMFHPENSFLHNQWLSRPHSWKIRGSSHCIGIGTLGCDQGKGDTGEPGKHSQRYLSVGIEIGSDGGQMQSSQFVRNICF